MDGQTLSLEERVNACKKELNEILKKYNLQIGAVYKFPIYNILPEEVELALKVVDKHGIEFHTAFRDVDSVITVKEGKK